MHLHRVALSVVLTATALGAASIEEHLKGKPTSYACDTAVTSGTISVQMHQIVDGDQKMRIELAKPMPMAVIVRRDLGKTITLQGKSALVKPLDEAQAKRFAPPRIETERYDFAASGTETVDGVSCDRFTATPKADSGAAEPGTMWIGQSDHMLRKWLSSDGRTTVLCTNVAIGAQAAALFEAPEGAAPIAH